MPASVATSSRRRPGVRRRPVAGTPRSVGVIFSRRPRRNSPSCWVSTSALCFVRCGGDRVKLTLPARFATPDAWHMTSRTWFLTGASRGLGAIWAEAVLNRGDNLAATARDAAALQPLADTYGD